MTLNRLTFAATILVFAMSYASAQNSGTIAVPTAPTVPSGRPVGQSTIIAPMSAPSTTTTGNAGPRVPCGASVGSAGSVTGNGGTPTRPNSTAKNSNNVPNMKPRPARPESGINPSVTPGVPSSC